MNAPIGIDQEAYHVLIAEACLYLDALSQQLAQSYEELHPQNVDISDLGSATEALMFASEKLKDQKVTLEAYRNELRKDITSAYGEDTNGKEKEQYTKNS